VEITEKAGSVSQIVSKTALSAAVVATLIVNPWTNYDPINLPKFSVLLTSAFFLIPFIRVKSSLVDGKSKIKAFTFFLLPISCLVALFSSESPKMEQIWGTWGRNTGILTLLSLYFIAYAISTVSNSINISLCQKIFHRIGYVISTYAILQLADLDPIQWSQKLPFATLGNLNFMSAFIGLTSISMMSKVIFKESFSAKVFYIFFICINVYLIWETQSIQGLAMLAIGVVVLFAYKFWLTSRKLELLLLSITSTGFGLLILIGSAGIGPLGSLLRQETILFRIDYWTAAIQMIKAKPLVGVGVDAYGDYYRSFRSDVAVERTGPSRVSNTAHNIFLDYASGSGIFAGLSLLILFIMGFYILYLRLRQRLVTDVDLFLAPLLSAFLFFCFISINQIGVTVWGFIILGYVLGLSTNDTFDPVLSRQKESKKKKVPTEPMRNSTVKPNSHSRSRLYFAVVLGIFGLYLSSIPVLADARFLKIYRADEIAIKDFSSQNFSTFHKEKLTEKAIARNSLALGVDFARELVAYNPRSFFGWSVLAYSGGATAAEARNAKERLISLDPKNQGLTEDHSASP
jgi:O-antigen ligase